jgi:hypothetical protein
MPFETGLEITTLKPFTVMAEKPSFRESGTPSLKHEGKPFCLGDCGSSPQ